MRDATARDLLAFARRYAHGRHTYSPTVVRMAAREMGGFDPDPTLRCVKPAGDGINDCLCDDCLGEHVAARPAPALEPSVHGFDFARPDSPTPMEHPNA